MVAHGRVVDPVELRAAFVGYRARVTWFLDKQFLETLDLRAYDAEAIAARVGLPRDTVAAFVDPARRYWIKSCPEYGWLAGADASHRPTILFVGSPRLAPANTEPLNAVTFDLEAGTVTTRAIAFDGELEWDDVLDVAEEEIGFIHVGDAPVLAFKHPQIWHYALVPFPFDLHDDALGRGDGEPDGVREWIEAGNYVLHCGNAYSMGPEGDVESS